MGRQGDQAVVEDDALDARKASGWALLAGLARLATVLAPDAIARPWPFDAIVAVATGLVLPVVAVLHARHEPLRRSGAVLGTIAAVSAAVVAAAGVGEPRLGPAAVLLLGMWWWTIGKMWVETDVLPRAFGMATAALGVIAIASALLPITSVFAVAQAALGAWLIALAAALWRRADVPSR